MEPHGGFKAHLRPDGEQHGRDAGETDDEEGGAVGRIGKRVVEPAYLAFRRKRQKSVEQMALSAARAAAADTDLPWHKRGIVRVIVHDGPQTTSPQASALRSAIHTSIILYAYNATKCMHANKACRMIGDSELGWLSVLGRVPGRSIRIVDALADAPLGGARQLRHKWPGRVFARRQSSRARRAISS